MHIVCDPHFSNEKRHLPAPERKSLSSREATCTVDGARPLPFESSETPIVTAESSKPHTILLLIVHPRKEKFVVKSFRRIESSLLLIQGCHHGGSHIHLPSRWVNFCG
jgi:hypothetical protein